MGTFVIQVVGGLIRHDFSSALLEALEYQNWRCPGVHSWFLVEGLEGLETFIQGKSKKETDEFVPVGSLEFVSLFLSLTGYSPHLRPINIPDQLLKEEFLGRKFFRGASRDFKPDKQYFVKSSSRIKDYAAFISPGEFIPEPYILATERVELVTEWRAFIYNKSLLGLQNYLGDFTVMPDVMALRGMMEAYTDSPSSYTLDIGVMSSGKTVVIEVHDFYSCGTYGFSDPKRLPQMFASAFNRLKALQFITPDLTY